MEYKHYTDDLSDKIESFLFSGIYNIFIVENRKRGQKLLLIGENHQTKQSDSYTNYVTKPNLGHLERFVRYVTKEMGIPIFFEGKNYKPEKAFSMPNIREFLDRLVNEEGGTLYSVDGFGILGDLVKIQARNPDWDLLIDVDDRLEFAVKNFKNSVLDSSDWRSYYFAGEVDPTAWPKNLQCFVTVKDYYILLNHHLSLYFSILLPYLLKADVFNNPLFTPQNSFLWKFKINWDRVVANYKDAPFVKKFLRLLNDKERFECFFADTRAEESDRRRQEWRTKYGNYEENVLRPLRAVIFEIVEYFTSFSALLRLAVDAAKNYELMEEQQDLFETMYRFYTAQRRRDAAPAREQIHRSVAQMKRLLGDDDNLIMTKLFPVIFHDYGLLSNGIYETDPPIIANFIPRISPDCLSGGDGTGGDKDCGLTLLMYYEKFERQVADYFSESPGNCIFIGGGAHVNVLSRMLLGRDRPYEFPSISTTLSSIFNFTRDKKFLSMLFNSFELFETEDGILVTADEREYGMSKPKESRHKRRRRSISYSHEYKSAAEYKRIAPVFNNPRKTSNLGSIVLDNMSMPTGDDLPDLDLRRAKRVNVDHSLFQKTEQYCGATEAERRSLIELCKKYYHAHTSGLYDDVKNDYSAKDYRDLGANVQVFVDVLQREIVDSSWSTFKQAERIFGKI